MTSHQKRISTGLVLLGLFLYFIFWAPPFVFRCGVFVLSALGLLEFYGFFWPQKQGLGWKMLGLILAGLIVFHEPLGMSPLAVLVLGFWAVNLFFLWQYGQGQAEPWPFLVVLLCGLLYIPLALQILVGLKAVEIVLILLASFISDMGAFYIGKWRGKRPLWLSVSPKKTWEGSLGGLLSCLAIALLIGVGFGALPWYHWLWIGLLLNIAAQLGDLFESALKRQLEIKDSGRMLPGHGGILDRFDSVLFVLPVYLALQHMYPLF
jgi:phosphatidate cytidylyltransferase